MNKTSLLKLAKEVENTPSKLYENKGIAWRSNQRYHHEVQRDYPRLYGVPRWTLKAASHWPKSVWSKADGRYSGKLA